MEALALLICVLLTVQSLIKDAPCVQEQEPSNHEAQSYQQPQLSEVREAGQPEKQPPE